MQKQSQNPNTQARVRLYNHWKELKVQFLNTFRTGTSKVLRCLTLQFSSYALGVPFNCLHRNSIRSDLSYSAKKMAEKTKNNFQQGQNTKKKKKKRQFFVHLGNFAYKSYLHEDTTLFPAVNLHIFMFM